MGFRRVGLMLCVIVGMSVPAAVADANTSTSLNWSGYAVHRAGVKFRRVSGEWRVPAGSCAPGSVGYSAFWLGLGGYSLTSRALEQVGTEFDCTATGLPRMSAWYELVPSRVHRIRLTLHAGDLIRARVRVAGHKVTVSLENLTRGRSFQRTLRARQIDISSAEWIAEAPSECGGVSNCSILPLADFGSIGFTRAGVETTNFHWGGVANRHWNTSRILLANTNGRRYVSSGGPSARATPSGLTRAGRAFTITYAGSPAAVPSSGAIVASTQAGPTPRPLARQSG